MINNNVKIKILFLFLLYYSNTSKAQISKNSSDSIYAKYTYKDSDSFGSSSIILLKNHSYLFINHTDVAGWNSRGKWKKNKDTITLNSDLQKNNIPISVNEFNRKSKDNSIKISWIRNLNGDIMKDVALYANSDLCKNCFPVFNDCEFKVGEIHRIRVKLMEDLLSKWYQLKNIHADSLNIIILANSDLSTYEFFSEKKYLIVKDKLYELIRINVKALGKTLWKRNTSFYFRYLKLK